MKDFIYKHPLLSFAAVVSVTRCVRKVIEDVLYTVRVVTTDGNYTSAYKDYIESCGNINDPPKRYYERGKGKENEDAELDKNEQMEGEENEVDTGSEVSDDGDGESE